MAAEAEIRPFPREAPSPLSPREMESASEPRLVTDIPGPRTLALIEADHKVTSPSLPRAYPFAPARGAGSMIEDVDGNLFLDFNSGIAVCSTGHAHPKVVKAIQEQADRLLHYSGGDFYLPIYAEVCAELDRVTEVGGPARTFLTNSGTEAVEGAIKLARNSTGRQYLIAFIGGFHGRSYGSVSLTASKAKYHAGFGPLLPGVLHAPFGVPPSEYIEPVIFARLVPPNEVAAIVVEPILGEGGYVVPPDGWLGELRDLCSRHGILLIVDEIQSGMGRTGRMWAYQHEGITPDIVLAGKGIASGMPLGAMIARHDIMTWVKGAHGSTYAGNPLCCAAALATMELLEGELIENAARVGADLLDDLRHLQQSQPLVREARGRGLMIGAEFENGEAADAVELACLRRGLLVLRAGDSAIRIAPPLVLRPDQARVGLGIFEEACAEVAAGPAQGSDPA
ncbi:MAG: aminotransferase class III-fold pyridoxal phosphate-dependent enzyme [Actinomycetota bacterium]